MVEDSHFFCPWDGTPYGQSRDCSLCGKPRYIRKPKWEKVLYKKQPFEDTYVDDSFLEILEMQETSYEYDFWDLVEGTSEVNYALSTVALYFYLFSLSFYEVFNGQTLILSEFMALCIGSILYLAMRGEGKQVLIVMRSGLILLLTLLLLLPILMTINKNYADDTIYLLTFTFTVGHLIFYDYSFVGEPDKSVPGVVSMVSSLIVALMMGSRLNSGISVFYTHLLALMLFCFFPYLRKLIKARSENSYKYGNFLLSVLNFGLLSTISWKLGFFALFLFVFILLACPLWLIWVYGYKNEIKGPWDLPNVKIS